MRLFESLALSFVVALSTLTACSTETSNVRLAERVDSAGIELVINRGPDRPIALDATPRLTLGGKDEGPESFFRVRRGTVAVDGAGNIHVVDFDAKRVVVFDSTGKHLRTLGGPGQGPGELMFPNTISVMPDGRVSVLDFSKDGVVQWGPDGSVLPSIRIKATSPAQDIAVMDSAVIYSWTDFRRDAPTEATLLQRERGDSVELLARMERPPPKMAQFSNCGIMMRLPPLLSPELSWAAKGSRIAVIAGAEYQVVLHDGAKRMFVRRDVAPQPATLEIAEREVGDSMRVRGGSQRCSIPPAEVAEVRGFAAVVPAARDVLIGPDGGLWVRRGGPRLEPAPIDRFDRDGNYLGTLAAGSPQPVAFMPNGDIVAAEKDRENDVERLVVYRVR